jgi:hypothetical protein
MWTIAAVCKSTSIRSLNLWSSANFRLLISWVITCNNSVRSSSSSNGLQEHCLSWRDHRLCYPQEPDKPEPACHGSWWSRNSCNPSTGAAAAQWWKPHCSKISSCVCSGPTSLQQKTHDHYCSKWSAATAVVHQLQQLASLVTAACFGRSQPGSSVLRHVYKYSSSSRYSSTLDSGAAAASSWIHESTTRCCKMQQLVKWSWAAAAAGWCKSRL